MKRKIQSKRKTLKSAVIIRAILYVTNDCPWCGPMRKVFDAFAARHRLLECAVVNMETATKAQIREGKRFGITVAPTVVFAKNKSLVARFEGATTLPMLDASCAAAIGVTPR